MRKIVFIAHTDVVGTDHYELVEYEDDVTDKTLDEEAYTWGHQWWDSFGPSSDLEDFDGNEEDWYQDYYEQCGAWWEEYNPEKHDGYLH